MKIVIVGGGAGGLELATYLGKRLGKCKRAEVVLIDRNSTHVWKPLLHEVAAGSLDAEIDSVSYRGHASANHFRFKMGTFDGLDREAKVIHLLPVYDEDGNEVLPSRDEPYDYLVMAIGSSSNDFGVTGVLEHCRFLDSTAQAKRFHDRLVSHFIRLNRRLMNEEDAKLRVAIVGGGATGVELAAELFNSRKLFNRYGLDRLQEDSLEVVLLEAGERLVPALDENTSSSVLSSLENIGAQVRLNTQVSSVKEKRYITASGEVIEADILLWAAGVKVPDILKDIDSLETNRINQLLVNPHLQVSKDPSIFAIGDCAGYQLTETRWVPPRAQSAHQMAKTVGKNLVYLSKNKPLKTFKYKDMGSLINLSHYSTYGVLMGNLVSGDTVNVRGRLARIAYISLYRMHQIALHGWFRATLLMIADKINHILKPRLKLH